MIGREKVFECFYSLVFDGFYYLCYIINYLTLDF